MVALLLSPQTLIGHWPAFDFRADLVPVFSFGENDVRFKSATGNQKKSFFQFRYMSRCQMRKVQLYMPFKKSSNRYLASRCHCSTVVDYSIVRFRCQMYNHPDGSYQTISDYCPIGGELLLLVSVRSCFPWTEWTTVVGHPISVKQHDKPTTEEVRAIQEQYIAQLTRYSYPLFSLWLTHVSARIVFGIPTKTSMRKRV